MSTGDFLLLLESHSFAYAGQVLHRVSEPLWDFSTHIWGEGRFPLIVLLQGELINYAWNDFARTFGFDPKYHMRGNTMRIKAERLAGSKFRTEEAFIAQLATTTGTTVVDQETDFRAFSSNLQSHYRQVKQRAKQRRFRQEVMNSQGHACAVCDLAIPSILDAAHIVEKEKDGTDDPRNGLVLCALHHRMFDRGFFVVHPASLEVSPLPPYTLAELRITRSDIGHLPNKPHRTALDWRWEHRGS